MDTRELKVGDRIIFDDGTKAKVVKTKSVSIDWNEGCFDYVIYNERTSSHYCFDSEVRLALIKKPTLVIHRPKKQGHI